jgi:NAD(P)H-hydrate epimerase
MLVVTAAEMRRLEQAAVDAGASWHGLMEQAGWGVAQEALHLLAQAGTRAAAVLVGPGNNGGDGLVVARHLHDAGVRVALYVWRRDTDAPDLNWQRCRERDIPYTLAADDSDGRALRRLLASAALVVDALLGAGAGRAVTGDLLRIVETVNELRGRVDAPTTIHRPFMTLAVDLPTGISADTGEVLGAAIRADVTVATGLLKRGLLLYPGKQYAGRLALADLDLPPAALEDIMSETLNADLARGLLPPRPDDSHKGTYGKAMVVAGSVQYPGAATLATSAALRAGAGLVTLATGRSTLGAGRSPEVTLLPLPEAEWGVLGEPAAAELLKKLAGYTALLVGPGLGHEDATGEFLQRLVGLHRGPGRGRVGFLHGDAEPQRDAHRSLRGRVGFLAGGEEAAKAEEEKAADELPPIVIDADGLNLLAKNDDWHEHLPKGRLVLTPHPGEMRRLLGVEQLESDSAKVAADAAARWGQVVVLKGATTVVASPEGRTLLHAAGNPALATAGTGDVLAGTIVGLLAQGLAPFDAAALGVYLHGAAGAIVRAEVGDMGAIASDLLPRLPQAIRALK